MIKEPDRFKRGSLARNGEYTVNELVSHILHDVSVVVAQIKFPVSINWVTYDEIFLIKFSSRKFKKFRVYFSIVGHYHDHSKPALL